MALGLARRNPDVSLAGLTRTVDDASHDRNLDGQVARLQGLLGLLGHCNHVDLGSAATRAGDEVEALAFSQAERFEELATGARLFDRVGG